MKKEAAIAKRVREIAKGHSSESSSGFHRALRDLVAQVVTCPFQACFQDYARSTHTRQVGKEGQGARGVRGGTIMTDATTVDCRAGISNTPSPTPTMPLSQTMIGSWALFSVPFTLVASRGRVKTCLSQPNSTDYSWKTPFPPLSTLVIAPILH